MRIVLIGMKGSGKTTTGKVLADHLQVPFIDADAEIEHMHRRERGEALAFRQIFQQYGTTYFQALETRTLQHMARECEHTDYVFACGGGTPLQAENREILPRLGIIIYLDVDRAVLLKRILAHGIPAFFPYQDDAEKSLDVLLAEREPVYKAIADLTIAVGEGSSREAMQTILKELSAYEQH